MKKIFLIPLLALFCSVSLWAENNVAKITFSDNRTPVECADEAALRSALAALPTDGVEATITLLKNIEIKNASYGMNPTTYALEGDAKVINFPANTKSVLNLNGKAIDKTMSGGLSFGNANIDKLCVIYNQGELRIINEGNSILQLAVNKSGEMIGNATTICNDGTLTIDGGIFLGPNGGNDLPKCPVIWAKSGSSNITINGGTFLCYEGLSDYNKGADLGPISGPGTWTIKGGIFSTDEMVGILDSHKSTKDWFLTDRDNCGTDYHPATGYKAIEVPYTNANIKGYDSWRTDPNNSLRVMEGVEMTGTTSTDKDNGVYQHYRYAVKPVCAVVPTTDSHEVTTNENTTGNADYNFVYVDPGKTLTIKDGHKVTVGDAGVILGGTDSKIIIEAGGTLVSGGDIVTSSEENLELTMDAVNDKYAQLMIKPNAMQEKHPDATVILKSKAYKKNGAYTWQRFAVPTYLDGDQSLTRADMEYDHTIYPTALYRWDYESTRENKWTAMDNSTDKFTPFDCYELTTTNTTKGGEYTFKCELVGNGDANLQLDNDRWSYFANSYTAPINIEEMLWELFTNDTYKNNIAASVYVHNRADENWDLVSFADVLDEKTLAHNNINPMQAFVLWKIAAIDDYTLHYEDVIYKPAMGISAQHAPARRAQAGMDYQRASIVFSDENGKKDIVKLYEGSDFDNTLNNGFDVAKLMNEGQFSVYAVAEEGEMARLASDNIENATISMQTKGATTFTLSFENVKMEGYGVRDNLTGTTTEIKEGNIYHFTTPANAIVEGRFQVVAMPKITTAIENVENATATKGIYTLTGIYMGEDFNAVPAGIYIVNGKKMVK